MSGILPFFAQRLSFRAVPLFAERGRNPVTQQARLAIYEDETDALRELVRELGGTKVVGVLLRPDLAADRAGAWLKDCLNPERPERLQPSQLFHLLRMGHDRGVHGPAEFILGNVGYSIQPIEPQDEMAALQRTYIESVQLQRRIADRMERLTRAPLASVGNT